MSVNFRRPFSSDAPFLDELRLLSYANLHERDDLATTKALRAKVRYLAALFPYEERWKLAETIHAIVANKNWTIDDVYIILDGRSLSDPSRTTNEVPLDAIQKLGEQIMSDVNLRTAAKVAGMAYSTAQVINDFLGLTQAREDSLMDDAYIAVREGWTVNRLAAVSQVSRSRAGRLIQKARGILIEIGEIQ